MKRNYGFEILKILSMMMVVIMHALGHGKILENCQIYTFDYMFFWGIRALVYPCVNCFVLISGYYLCMSYGNIVKIYRLWTQVLFYSLTLYVLSCIIGIEKISIKNILYVLTPISSGEYWFVTCYVLLYIFSPFCNLIIDKMSREQHRYFLLLLIFIFSIFPTFLYWSKNELSNGRDVQWFFCLYFIASYIRKYGISNKLLISKWSYFVVSLVLIATNVIITIIRGSSAGANIFYYNNSPFVLIATISLFYIFINIKCENKKIINILRLSEYSLGIYLLHENRFFRTFIWKFFSYTDNLGIGFIGILNNIVLIVFSVVVISLFGIFIEILRKKIYKHCFLYKLEKIIASCDTSSFLNGEK